MSEHTKIIAVGLGEILWDRLSAGKQPGATPPVSGSVLELLEN